ncbi:39S ribosomal mitochondrial [Labeo rohita]|uniref:39S ribosomal mitochondrial n=1 Tax=Labeo rohita TaxID=84645 RepID=A0A498MKV1_LABRO|nr:39S ribosomal mitochondrial [Labeo rohita]
MSVSLLSCALRSLSLGSRTVSSQIAGLPAASGVSAALTGCRGFMTSSCDLQNRSLWKQRDKYTTRPIGMKKTGGRDYTGKIITHRIGGGHKQRYRMIDFQRLRYESGKEDQPIVEKVIEVRYDPCRSADIALVAGGSRKRWIIATENMEAGDLIRTSSAIGRMAVLAKEGDSHPLGALPVGTLVNNLELYPGKGAQYIRAAGNDANATGTSDSGESVATHECFLSAGTCGVLLRKVNGTAIVQLPSKHQIQVLETCMVTVGRVSNVDHNKRVIGKAGRNRWLGIRPSSGLWQRKGGWAGRKIRPLPPMKSFVNLPSVAAKS